MGASTIIGHAFVYLGVDGAQPQKVQPQRDWNDDHVLKGGATGSILVRDASTDPKPGASYIAPVAAGSVLISQGAAAKPVWSTAPTVTSMTTATVIGGSANTATLTLKSSSANSLDGADIIMGVGNNGASVGLRITQLTGSVLVAFPGGGFTAAQTPAFLNGAANLLSLKTQDNSAFSSMSIQNLTLNGTIAQMASSGQFAWQNRSTLFSPADGVVEFLNNAGTGFTSLKLGGTTASFPALKVSGAALQVRLADDSAFGSLTVDTLTTNTTLSVTTTASVTTSLTTPALIGGTGTTSTLTLSPTSSGASTTGADIIFQASNGGAELVRLQHNGLMTFGGTGATVSALKSAGVTVMSIRLGDDSGYADLQARSIISNGASTGFQCLAGAQIFWTSRANLSSPADAKMKLANNALSSGVTLDATTADTLKVQVLAANAYGTVDALAYKLSGTAVQASQSAPGDPVGTTDTATGKMMGLAVLFTPSSTRVLIIISGSIWNQTGGDGAIAQISTGTGSAPTNGAAVTGTARGNASTLTNDATANNKFPFTCSAIVTGLSAGTQIWIDILLKAVTGGTANIGSLSVQAYDLV